MNEWFIALQRWEDFPGEDFLTYLDLWVQIKVIPLFSMNHQANHCLYLAPPVVPDDESDLLGGFCVAGR